MDTDNLAKAKDEALRIAKSDKRINLPIWAWVVAGVVLIAAGAWWFG